MLEKSSLEEEGSTANKQIKTKQLTKIIHHHKYRKGNVLSKVIKYFTIGQGRRKLYFNPLWIASQCHQDQFWEEKEGKHFQVSIIFYGTVSTGISIYGSILVIFHLRN